jgi:hypothetical protein
MHCAVAATRSAVNCGASAELSSASKFVALGISVLTILERKLAADVAGYSRLMEEDKAGTSNCSRHATLNWLSRRLQRVAAQSSN